MKMHLVAFVVLLNVFLVLNVCGVDSHHRYRRSPKNKYDENYDKFLQRHFSDVGEKHLDKSQAYKEVQTAADDDDDDSDDYDDASKKGKKAELKNAKDDVEVDDDHDWYYEGKKDYERIKALSEKQVEELLRKPGNCKQYEKDGMVCATCSDPDTGDNSESCAYSSTPNDKKVAYLSKKSHNYKKPQPAEAEESAEDAHEDDESEDEEEAAVNPEPADPKPSKSESDDADYGAYKLAGSSDDVEDYDEPKLGQIRVAEETTTEKFVNDFEIITQKSFEPKSLNEALTDFTTKDWSKCNKLMKGDMTCYYCKDKKAAVQEECMFVSASNPKHFKVQRQETTNYDNSKKPSPASTRAALKYAATPRPYEYDETTENQEKKKRFARMRIGRPLMPTRASILSTAEPLVTPKSFTNPIESDDYSNLPSKKTIKRTVSMIKKRVYGDDMYEPAESRAISFRSFVTHFD